MLLNSVVVFVHRRAALHVSSPQVRRTHRQYMYYRSVGHGYHAIPISHSPLSQHAAPHRAASSRAGSRLQRKTINRAPRVRVEGRTSDSLTDLVKIRKLPSAHLQSITAFPAAGARPSSSRIICLSRARRISRFDFVLCASRAASRRRRKRERLVSASTKRLRTGRCR